jgi:outer membrane receptor for ferrienterochelin and colicin
VEGRASTTSAIHFDGFSESRRGGAFRFRTLEEMLRLNRSATAQADRFTGVLPGTDTDRHMRQNYAAIFVQDDYRMSDRLSMSLGLCGTSSSPRRTN